MLQLQLQLLSLARMEDDLVTVGVTVRGDLIRTMHGLLSKDRNFDAIVVETTGLADPGPVAQTFFVDGFLRSKTELDSVNVLVVPGCPPVPELAELGVARISVGGAFAYAALAGLVAAAAELRDQGTYGYWDQVAAARPAVRAAFRSPGHRGQRRLRVAGVGRDDPRAGLAGQLVGRFDVDRLALGAAVGVREHAAAHFA